MPGIIRSLYDPALVAAGWVIGLAVDHITGHKVLGRLVLSGLEGDTLGQHLMDFRFLQHRYLPGSLRKVSSAAVVNDTRCRILFLGRL